MNAPISVIIPCYRCSATIQRAIDSVYSQTLKPLEILLVEDCSGDDTLEKLEKIARNYTSIPIIILEHTSNSGPGKARNTGWDTAKYKYVAFLDSDDTWHPEKLRLQYSWMESNPRFAFTGHACQTKQVAPNSHGARASTIDTTTFLEISINKLLAKNFFSTQTVMVRKDIPYRFRNTKRYCEDYLLACEICADGLACAASKSPLAYLHKEAYGAGGLSGDLWRMWKGELEVYYLLHHAGRIPVHKKILSQLYSSIRFLRRCLLVLGRKLDASLAGE